MVEKVGRAIWNILRTQRNKKSVKCFKLFMGMECWVGNDQIYVLIILF